jgi:hypothetical protein
VCKNWYMVMMPRQEWLKTCYFPWNMYHSCSEPKQHFPDLVACQWLYSQGLIDNLRIMQHFAQEPFVRRKAQLQSLVKHTLPRYPTEAQFIHQCHQYFQQPLDDKKDESIKIQLQIQYEIRAWIDWIVQTSHIKKRVENIDSSVVMEQPRPWTYDKSWSLQSGQAAITSLVLNGFADEIIYWDSIQSLPDCMITQGICNISSYLVSPTFKISDIFLMWFHKRYIENNKYNQVQQLVSSSYLLLCMWNKTFVSYEMTMTFINSRPRSATQMCIDYDNFYNIALKISDEDACRRAVDVMMKIVPITHHPHHELNLMVLRYFTQQHKWHLVPESVAIVQKLPRHIIVAVSEFAITAGYRSWIQEHIQPLTYHYFHHAFTAGHVDICRYLLGHIPKLVPPQTDVLSSSLSSSSSLIGPSPIQQDQGYQLLACYLNYHDQTQEMFWHSDWRPASHVSFIKAMKYYMTIEPLNWLKIVPSLKNELYQNAFFEGRHDLWKDVSPLEALEICVDIVDEARNSAYKPWDPLWDSPSMWNALHQPFYNCYERRHQCHILVHLIGQLQKAHRYDIITELVVRSPLIDDYVKNEMSKDLFRYDYKHNPHFIKHWYYSLFGLDELRRHIPSCSCCGPKI